MCGICGWIDFSEQYHPQKKQYLDSMTSTLSNRGPDDRGVWLGQHAGIGHCRLAILDPENSNQPMVANKSNTNVVLSYSGEIYNFQELRKELVRKGYRFKSTGDSEVVLNSYLEWGQSCVEKFNGMFAFAIWDERENTLFLARDRLGIKPLYYYRLSDGIIFGSEPKAILEHPAVEAIVDADGLRQVFGLVRSPGQAIYKGMCEVKPGHMVVLSYRSFLQKKYWSLESRPHEDDIETTVATTRELLEKTLEKQLVSDVPISTLLSGGLDSSALTAIAQNISLCNGSGPINTFSVTFGDNPDEFVPDSMRDSSDDPFIEIVLAHLETSHQSVLLNLRDMVNTEARYAALKARDLPTLGEIDLTLYLLFQAVSQHATVTISGEGADELFGGYRWFHDDNIIAQDAFPWLSMAKSLGRYSMFEPGGIALDVSAYQADMYADAIKAVPNIIGESPGEKRMREIRYLHLNHFISTPLERKDRMSMVHGLEVRVPFLNHLLVEYVFNVPWKMMTNAGTEKSLLRAALEGLLPDSVLYRKKNPFPSIQDPTYHKQLSREVKTLLARNDSPVLELMNRSTMRALASMPASGAHAVRMGLERILSVHEWLTRYKVSIQA